MQEYLLSFFLLLELKKKLLKIARSKKKKHNKVVMLTRSKLKRIEILMHQALIDSKIGRKEYNIIINEEEGYGKLKGNIRMIKSKQSDAEKDELKEEEEKIDIIKIIFVIAKKYPKTMTWK